MSEAQQDIAKAFELDALDKSTPPAVRSAAMLAKDAFASDEARIRCAAKLGSGLGASVTTEAAQALLTTALAHESYAGFLRPAPTPIEALVAHERERNAGSWGLKATNSGPVVALPGTPSGMPTPPTEGDSVGFAQQFGQAVMARNATYREAFGLNRKD